MPERPKRRKNKNKRKNKNNRSDTNRNNCEVLENESGESCSVPTGDDETLSETQETNESVVVEKNTTQIESVENAIIPELSSESLCEDLNNNSSTHDVETLQVVEDLNNSDTHDVETLQVVEDLNNSDTHDVETVQVSQSLINTVEEGSTGTQECAAYIVESPEQSLKSKPKFNNTVKSKSLDNDDAPKIVDITEDIATQSEEESALAFVDTSNILVSDVESDIEWEKTDELQDVELPPLNETGPVSVTTIPLSVAQCQEAKSLAPDVETSLRNYLRTLNLSTHPENADSVEIKAEIEQIINREIRHRLRKKGLTDDLGLQRLGPSRTLDVIDEEGSSESSKSSRRQSYLSDKRSDNDDLEDDVFEDKNKSLERISRKTEATLHKKTFGRLVPQECVLVGAKLKEPEVTEARGSWTTQTVEKMTGAEVVYLTDSSSSTSSLHDCGDETDDGMDTDVSVRMITPTIEVTDTENLLKNTFVSSKCDPENQNNDNKSGNSTNEHIIKVECENYNNKQVHTEPKHDFHEIVVLSTDDIKTNLYVKDVDSPDINVSSNEMKTADDGALKSNDKFDLEIKVLKCELNDAINNLIKEVSDSELNEHCQDTFARQDSSSSVCSSQCTAKYNPTSSSLNDVSNLMHDESSDNKLNTESNDLITTVSHVKDVLEHVAGATSESKNGIKETTKVPLLLRDLCVRKIASFPYGDKILEELASVSKRLQNITGAFKAESPSEEKYQKEESIESNMPYYPLPNITLIDKVILPTKVKELVPPPVQPRHSSLKKKSREEEVWTGVPTKMKPVYVCLSPSQKMLMEKTHTIITKNDASELADMHKIFVDRRGYNEHYSKDKHKDETGIDVSPIVPFKSQTGSRLLALIRDPTVTSNVNTFNKRSDVDHLQKKVSMSQTTATKHHNRFEDLSNTFKPIPPPRPKKLSSAYYESDESSDFTDSSLRSVKSERKFFHFSTGNLNKEIEDDISSIQNMHRYYTHTRDSINDCPRRPSLPKDLCDQQMEYIRQKEKEVETEIQRLESLKSSTPTISQKSAPKAPLVSEKEVIDEKRKGSNDYFIAKRRDFFSSLSTPENRAKNDSNVNDKKEKSKLSSLFSSSQEELLREKMYSEYVTQMAQREQRKQHKVIKITNTPAAPNNKISKSLSAIDRLNFEVNNRIEKEFISKARERWDKLGIKDPETEDEQDTIETVYREPKVIEHKIKVIEGGQEKDVQNLPSHLQEFVRFTAKDKEQKKDSTGESKSEPESPHGMIWCAVIIIVLAIGKYFLSFLRNK